MRRLLRPDSDERQESIIDFITTKAKIFVTILALTTLGREVLALAIDMLH